MSGIILEPSGDEHLEADEIIEEARDTINRPPTSSEQFGSEDAFSDIPNQSSSTKGVLNLEFEPSRKQLPHHHTRGIPKLTYELKLSSKVR